MLTLLWAGAWIPKLDDAVGAVWLVVLLMGVAAAAAVSFMVLEWTLGGVAFCCCFCC